MTTSTTPTAGRPTLAAWVLVVALWTMTAGVAGAATSTNLTCYQCERSTNEECGVASLLPCPSSKDRCVTHISKDPTNGFVLKRECGLGPCGFEDEMVNRGLGLQGCDRSKPEYFCIFCCKHSGCNKDAAAAMAPSRALIFLLTAHAIVLAVLAGTSTPA